MKAVLAAPALAIPLSWWTFLKPGRWLLLLFADGTVAAAAADPAGRFGPAPEHGARQRSACGWGWRG
jgi:hypothetical protein